MPTPFTHLAITQRLLADSNLPQSARALLDAERGAFLLGGIAPDAQMLCSLSREQTHFYSYERPIDVHPWRAMLAQYPDLRQTDPAKRAFLAGYAAHLAVDEYWSLHMLRPHFVEREWGTRGQRFLMLHALLITMDERDHAGLDPTLGDQMLEARPHNWLPFIDDDHLLQWGFLIYRQIMPGGESETLEILSPRVGKTPEDVRALLDSPERMQADLWDHIPPAMVSEIETGMFDHARIHLLEYLRESA